METGILEQICCLKPNPPEWAGPEDTPFTNTVRCSMVRGVPAHLKDFVVTLVLVSDLKAGDAAAQLDVLNLMGLTGPQSRRGQEVV